MFSPADDDDSSAASSGDEMLNMDISFSQNSTGAISPKKASAEDSDSSDAGGVGSGKKGGPQNAAKLLSGKKRAHDEVAMGIDGESDMEEKARVSAKKAFIIAFNDAKIGGPDKLFWLDRTKNYKKIISPVRMVSREETVGLHLKEWNPESQCPIQFIEYPHHNGSGQYAIASRRGLSAYYGKGEDRKQWCPIKLGQYSKQLKKNQRLTEEFYLQCALEKSLEEGEQEKKLAEVDEAMPEEITTSDLAEQHPEYDSEDEEDQDVTRGGSRRLTRGRTSMLERTERLRPGDRIAFYKPTFPAGDPRGYCEATILYTNKPSELILDEGFTSLEPEHQVKRIQRNHRGKLVDHDGEFREIQKYELRKEGDPDALKKIMAKQTAWATGIKDKLKEATVAKMKEDGFCPEDMLR